jgi:hypothetical protein
MLALTLMAVVLLSGGEDTQREEGNIKREAGLE